MFKVNEIFKSIQGEGIDIGLPMVFIRFAGCNLACKWCDTPYASREDSKYTEKSLEDTIEYVSSCGATAGVCLTGGEPFVQDTEELDKLIYALKGLGYFLNIETNGFILPDLKNGNLVDRFSVSPKLSSSENVKVKIKTLQKYVDEYPHKTFFKFVISNEDDFKEMVSILKKLKGFTNHRIPVIVQPNVDAFLALDVNKQASQFKEVLKMILDSFRIVATKYNIRIIPQIHKFIWQNKRGV